MTRLARLSLLSSTALALALTLAPGPAAGSAGRPGVATLNDCVVPDNGDPQLAGLSISPAVVDLSGGPASVTLRVSANDVGGPGPASGVANVMLALTSRERPRHPVRVWAQPAPDGAWAATVTVLPGQTSGTWYVREVRIEDHVGLGADLRGSDLDRLGIAHSFTVTGPDDQRRPRLTDLRVDRPTVVLHGRAVRLGVRARPADDLLVRSATVYATNTSTHRTVHADLHRTRSGSWASSLRLRAWNDNGRWMLGARVTDGAGKSPTYGVVGGVRHREPARSDAGFTVLGGGRDRRGPQVVSVQARPAVVDVRSVDQVVTVTAHLRDRAGIVRGGARIRALGVHGQLRRVSGSRHDGVWQARVPISRCRGRAGEFVVELKLHDAAGNRTGTGAAGHPHAAPLPVLAGDHQAPTFDPAMYEQPMPRTGPLTFRWTEDVQGISTSTAPLFVNYRRQQDHEGPPPVPGSWACVDAAGAAVDCVSGPVRAATFTPAAPLDVTPGTYYVMQFNPPGDLSVTDLAGNPATGFWFTPS